MRPLQSPFRGETRRSDRGRVAGGWSDPEDDGLVGLLDRYAVESFSADGAALARMRGAVMAAFVDAVTPADLDAGSRGAFQFRPRWPFGRSRHVLATAASAIVVLVLATGGLAAAESGPGQPFYRIRLGLELVNLPPAGTQTRLQADLNRAEARLGDLTGAAASGDWNGAADAAGAYHDVVASLALPAAGTGAGSGASARADLEAQLTRLEVLRSQSRPPETAAIDEAIATLAGLLGIPVPSPLPSAGDARGGPGGSAGASAVESPDHDPGGRESAEPEGTDGATDSAASSEPRGSIDNGRSNSHGPAATASGSADGGESGPGPSPSQSDRYASPSPSRSEDQSPGQSPGAGNSDAPAPTPSESRH